MRACGVSVLGYDETLYVGGNLGGSLGPLLVALLVAPYGRHHIALFTIFLYQIG